MSSVPVDEFSAVQDTLAALFHSPHMGVIVVSGPRIIAANDAFLRIIQHTREELQRGELNWPELTPAEYLPAANRALQEIIERGECAPFEKEFIVPDKSRVRVLIGSIRVQEHPLTWISYIHDLSATRRYVPLREENERLRVRTQKYKSLVRSAEVPLTVVTNWVRLMESEADSIDTQAKNFLPTVQQALESVQSKLKTILQK